MECNDIAVIFGNKAVTIVRISLSVCPVRTEYPLFCRLEGLTAGRRYDGKDYIKAPSKCLTAPSACRKSPANAGRFLQAGTRAGECCAERGLQPPPRKILSSAPLPCREKTSVSTASVFQTYFIRVTITAFWACRRFSASSKISSAWASNTSAVISSPRWAGRQCCTMHAGLAAAMQLVVDLIAGKAILRRCAASLLLAHGGPHVGEDHVRVPPRPPGSRRCSRNLSPYAVGKVQHLRVRLIRRRGRRRTPSCPPSGRRRSGSWPCCCRPRCSTSSAPPACPCAPGWSSGRPAPGRDGRSRSGR